MSESVNYQDIPSNASLCVDQSEVMNPEVTDSTKQTPLVDGSSIQTDNVVLNNAQIKGSTSVTSKINEQSSALKDTFNTINHNDLALLYDINDVSVADKIVNTMTSQKVNDILSGKVDVECNIFKQWHTQSDFNFGFVPLSDFISVTNKEQGPEIDCPFASHTYMKASGVPNFLKSRVPV